MARLAPVYEEERRKNQEASRAKPGEKIGSKVAADVRSPYETGKTSEKLAEISGVGARTIDRATKVLKEGVDEVVAAVDKGELSLNKAEDIVKLPKEEQPEALKEALVPKQKKSKPIIDVNLVRRENEKYLAENPVIRDTEERREVSNICDKMALEVAAQIAKIETIVAQTTDLGNIKDILDGHAHYLHNMATRIEGQTKYMEGKKCR